MKRIAGPLLLAIVLVAGVAGVRNARPLSQAEASPNPQRPDNWWRFQPTPDAPAPSDSAERDLFLARADYFDRLFGPYGSRLDDPNPVHNGISFSGGPAEEVPVYAREVIVTGLFSSYRAILTPSRRSIYTDATVSVDRVLYSDPVPGPSAGDSVDVLEPFGAVLLDDGRVISRGLSPETPYIQPGRRYLLFLGYRSSGDFFEPVKEFDLTGGVATPVDAIDIGRQLAGKSTLAGLPETDLIAQVLEMLKAEKSAK